MSEKDLSENYRHAIINVTIKNTGDEPLIPSTILSSDLMGEDTNLSPQHDIFAEKDEALEPGDEITGDLLFTGNTFIENEFVFLTYETATAEETEFELLIQEK